MERKNYVAKPAVRPDHEGSMKRQRVDDQKGGVLSLFPVGRLPKEVALLERFEDGKYGMAVVTGLNDDDVVVPWVLHGKHLFIWKQSSRRRVTSEIYRMAIPAGSAQLDQRWFVSAFQFQEEPNIGVLLIGENGHAICWACISNAVPTEARMEIESSIVMTKSHADDSVSMTVVGTDDGNLFLLWISSSDLCLRQVQIHSSDLKEGSGGITSFVGRWLGFGGARESVAQSRSPAAKKRGEDEECRLTIKSMTLSGVSEGLLFLYVLFSDNEIQRFDINTETMSVSEGWKTSDLSVDIRNRIGRSSGYFSIVSISAIVSVSLPFLLCSVHGPYGLVCMELRDILSSNVPRLCRESPCIELDPTSAYSVVVHSSEQIPEGVVFVGMETGDSLIILSSRSFGEWQSFTSQGITTGWFCLEAVNGSSPVQAAILSETCVVGITFDKEREKQLKALGVAGSDANRETTESMHHLSQSERNKSTAQFSAASRPERTKHNGMERRMGQQVSGLDEVSAKHVFARVVRAFHQTTAQGLDGITVAQEDKEWSQLIQTDESLLGAAIKVVAEKELDRSPNQRWADRSEENSTGRSDRPDQSGLKLIYRHLLSKASRLGSPDGLMGFLEKSEILDVLSERSVWEVSSCACKLAAAIRLCELHGRLNPGGFLPVLGNMMHAIVQNRLRSKVKNLEDIEQQLRSSGLNFFDLFYSVVSELEILLVELPVYLDRTLSQDGSNIGQLLEEANSIALSLLLTSDSAQVPSSLDPMLKPGSLLFPWNGPAEVCSAIRKLIEINWNEIGRVRNTIKVVEQVGLLTDVYLDHMEFAKVERQEKLWALISFFVRDSQRELPDTSLEIAQALCEKHASLKGTLEIYRSKKEKNLDFLVRNVLRTSLCKIKLKNFENEESVELKTYNEKKISFDGQSRWRLETHEDCTEYGDSNVTTIRWSIRLEKGFKYISLGANGSVTMVEKDSMNGLTENEMFEIIHVKNNAHVFFKGWDGVSFLQFDFDSEGNTIIASTTNVEDWAKLPELAFSVWLEDGDGFEILDVVEGGMLDSELEAFLCETVLTEKEPVLEKIRWLNHLRLGRYNQAAEALSNSSDFHVSKLARDISKLCKWVDH